MGPDLLSQGLQLMLIGMSTVFSFLIFLVFVTILMSKIVRGMEPEHGAYAQLAVKFGIEESHAQAIAMALEQHAGSGRNENG